MLSFQLPPIAGLCHHLTAEQSYGNDDTEYQEHGHENPVKHLRHTTPFCGEQAAFHPAWFGGTLLRQPYGLTTVWAGRLTCSGMLVTRNDTQDTAETDKARLEEKGGELEALRRFMLISTSFTGELQSLLSSQQDTCMNYHI
jgi:hypothetical protein